MHGMSGSPEFKSWHGMLQRCYNETDREFKRYGGRGISVCPRWKESFQNFFDDMGAKPSKGMSIDRYPNNDGNYEPGNCRWATPLQQAQNRRNNRLSSFIVGYAKWQHSLGRSIAELSRSLSLPYSGLRQAILANYWREE